MPPPHSSPVHISRPTSCACVCLNSPAAGGTDPSYLWCLWWAFCLCDHCHFHEQRAESREHDGPEELSQSETVAESRPALLVPCLVTTSEKSRKGSEISEQRCRVRAAQSSSVWASRRTSSSRVVPRQFPRQAQRPLRGSNCCCRIR